MKKLQEKGRKKIKKTYLFILSILLTIMYVVEPVWGKNKNQQPDVIPASAVASTVVHLLQKIKPNTIVDVEMYEFTDPTLIHALQQAKKQGANVHVILDATVSGNQATASELSRVHIPVAWMRIRQDNYQNIDHVKLFLAGNSALLGGVNWGVGSGETTDSDILQQGSKHLQALFQMDWKQAKTNHFRQKTYQNFHSKIYLTGNAIEPALVHAIQKAKRTIRIFMFAFDDRTLIQNLIQAHRRGVEIFVRLDSYYEHSFNEKVYRELKQQGIQVQFAPSQSMLHAKTAIFDGKTIITGSANWTYSGMEYNHELDEEIQSSYVAKKIQKMLAK